VKEHAYTNFKCLFVLSIIIAYTCALFVLHSVLVLFGYGSWMTIFLQIKISIEEYILKNKQIVLQIKLARRKKNNRLRWNISRDVDGYP